MLGVDRIVLDRRVQPQAVAILAVVERALQRAPAAARASAPTASASPAPAGPHGRLVLILVPLALLALGLLFGCLQLRSDERVVLGSEIDFVGVVGGDGALGGFAVANQLVLALELLDVTDGDLELVSYWKRRYGLAVPTRGSGSGADAEIYEPWTVRKTSAYGPIPRGVCGWGVLGSRGAR